MNLNRWESNQAQRPTTLLKNIRQNQWEKKHPSRIANLYGVTRCNSEQ